jgi:hypothetical protein
MSRTRRQAGRVLIERRRGAARRLRQLGRGVRPGLAAFRRQIRLLYRAARQALEVMLQAIEREARKQWRCTLRQLRQRRLGQQRQYQVAAADSRGPAGAERRDQPGMLEQQRQMA